MANRSVWLRADILLGITIASVTLATCAALAVSSEGIISVLAVVVTVCSRTFTEAVTHRWDISRFLALAPFGLGLTLASMEAFRLLNSTLQWMSQFRPRQCQPTRRLADIAQKCGLGSKTVLVRTHQPIVFTHGLLQPKVWLSTGLIELLTDEQLEAVLWHESKHRASYDPLKILFARCLSRALFFVPVARDLCGTYLVTKEISADVHATRMIGGPLPLASALAKMLSTSVAPLPNASLTGNSAIIETRLLTLLDPLRPLPAYPLERIGASLVWLTFLVLAALAPGATHIPSFSECTVSAAAKFGLLWPL
ncbi:MAG TPA: M56 family metallopeptidase [Anaerolineales bacterium]|nr:M56 family metallopeptidase [Anaerolineales bacterium]